MGGQNGENVLDGCPLILYLGSAKQQYTVFVPQGDIQMFLKGVALPRFYVVAADVIPVTCSTSIERPTRSVIASRCIAER
jgi:hypothetical protein